MYSIISSFRLLKILQMQLLRLFFFLTYWSVAILVNLQKSLVVEIIDKTIVMAHHGGQIL